MGWLTAVSDSSGLRSLRFGREEAPSPSAEGCSNDEVVRQLNQYFAGERREFDLPLHLVGTPFQIAVWQALVRIPFGETRSYGDIAAEIGRGAAARAVGMANNRNPLPIIVPCHRVIGRDGSLTGYAGGLHVKSRLLSHEGVPGFERSSATASHRGLSTPPLVSVPS